MPDQWLTPDERHELGRSFRKAAPRTAHGDWRSASDRKDPVALLEGQNEDRVEWLLPVRRARMSANPFAFFRGAARIMAHDLAATPVSGLQAQICGDAHLANFGNYASPERTLVFDLNDFDETLPGPWEWDVKRLATSFTIAGRHNGLKDKESRAITQYFVSEYRHAMKRFAGMRVTDVWYDLVDAERLIAGVDSKKAKKALQSMFEKARTKDSRQALDKLAEEVDGKYRIRSEPPFLVPFRDLAARYGSLDLEELAFQSFAKYLESVPDHVKCLLKQFRLVDAAVKVVGVGSVGTRCFVLLLEGRDQGDPLLLQAKEASKSVLEEHLPTSCYANSGQRVVEGQRLMQTVSDIFLGWVDGEIGGHQFYIRQLKDWKVSVDVDNASYDQLHAFARTRGWTLARAHARSGDPIAISGYLGSGKRFDQAIAEFAQRYADQNEQDYQAFRTEIDEGRLKAAELE